MLLFCFGFWADINKAIDARTCLINEHPRLKNGIGEMRDGKCETEKEHGVLCRFQFRNTVIHLGYSNEILFVKTI